MARPYPHVQTLAVAIVCILAVAGAFVYTRMGDTVAPERQDLSVVNEIRATSTRIVSDDSWKSAFLDTTSVPKATPSTITKLSDPLTMTDKLGRDFFARFIQLNQGGFLDNDQLVQSAIEQSIDSATREAQQVKPFALTDITITHDTDTLSIRSYANSVGRIFSDYGSDDDAATLANTAFEQGNMDMLGNIDPIITSYTKIVGLLKGVPVPQSLASYHLELMNAVNMLGSLSRDLRNADKDPMRAILALNSYSRAQKSIVSAIQSIKNYLSIAGLTFSSSEPGILFSLSL